MQCLQKLFCLLHDVTLSWSTLLSSFSIKGKCLCTDYQVFLWQKYLTDFYPPISIWFLILQSYLQLFGVRRVLAPCWIPIVQGRLYLQYVGFQCLYLWPEFILLLICFCFCAAYEGHFITSVVMSCIQKAYFITHIVMSSIRKAYFIAHIVMSCMQKAYFITHVVSCCYELHAKGLFYYSYCHEQHTKGLFPTHIVISCKSTWVQCNKYRTVWVLSLLTDITCIHCTDCFVCASWKRHFPVWDEWRMIYSVVTPNTHAHVWMAHILLEGRKQNVRVADNFFLWHMPFSYSFIGYVTL